VSGQREQKVTPRDAQVSTERVAGPFRDLVSLEIRATLLTVVQGPQVGQKFRVEDDPVRIGGASDNAVILSDPTVSRHHAEVLVTKAGLLIRDLDSTNGTYVDGLRIHEVFLRPGSRIRFGNTTLELNLSEESQVVAPVAVETFHGLIGQSLVMRQLAAILQRIARNDITVILSGETGTGKEMVAQALHAASPWAKEPFVVLDCSALDRDLAGSEIFGHEAGAFTGAVGSRAGAFEQAAGGTLFIDEIGELAVDLQAKLLRALEKREVKRLGGVAPMRVRCRVIAATHRDLPTLIKAGQFREDLYYRLAQVIVHVPSLRDRREDIPLLAKSFVAAEGDHRSLSEDALECLSQAPLAGNVRELKNLVRRACAMCASDVVTAADLDLGGTPAVADEEPASRKSAGILKDAEKQAILEALEKNGFNRRLAAKALGISVPTLRRRIQLYRLKVRLSEEPEDGPGR
jgi:DNA-binding NtrC family response regulator